MHIYWSANRHMFVSFSKSKYGYFPLSRSIFNTICPKNLLCSSDSGWKGLCAIAFRIVSHSLIRLWVSGWRKSPKNAPIDNWRSTWMGVPCHLHRSDSPEVHPILFHKKESSKWPVDNVASVGRWQAAARFYWVGWHAFRLVCGEWGWLWTRSLVEDSKRSIRPIAGYSLLLSRLSQGGGV